GFFRFLAGEAGSVAPMMALMLLPLAGTIAVGTEQAEWFYFQRATQNAADAAAIAAATNDSANANNGSKSTFQNEAYAAAAKFNFVDGSNHAHVYPSPVTCPPNASVLTGAKCYQVTISTWVPLSFSQVVGFAGSTTAQCQHCQLITSSAIATADAAIGTATPCIWAKVSFTSNGGPKPDLTGCTIYSNGDATCNGHNLSATYGVAVGTDNGCGITEISGAPATSDPYGTTAYTTNIPDGSNCSGKYPQEGDSGFSTTNTISGSIAPKATAYCGDIQLTGDVTLTGSQNIFTIYNGRLDTNGHKISTASGAGATILFTGTNATTYKHYSTGGGTLDIQAPTSGNWSGVALYQDPSLNNGVSFSYAGNSPTWNITGLVYLPNADVTFSGAVNKSSNGASCFIFVASTITVNGTAYIFANDTACASAGLVVPGVVWHSAPSWCNDRGGETHRLGQALAPFVHAQRQRLGGGGNGADFSVFRLYWDQRRRFRHVHFRQDGNRSRRPSGCQRSAQPVQHLGVAARHHQLRNTDRKYAGCGPIDFAGRRSHA
ncbi:MAG: pilus assembly protein TadG-related protein, partial [Pseudomonadota bacterium]|nr:pilus assembly protein TadG-related protein [Pseudomonadota bacterium]